mmetsp:Transcript_36790/g.87916  ORF Transcript_36790/g.87916 Transcript_36790/m.87916 type:complete len:228 (+) Transcript_36790:908-1591(+)
MRRNSVAAVVDLNPRLRFALQFSYHLAVFANDLADCRRRNHDVFLDGMSEGELSVFALLPANLVDAPLGKLDVIRAAPVCDYPRLALRDVLVNIDSSCGSCLQIADHLATLANHSTDKLGSEFIALLHDELVRERLAGRPRCNDGRFLLGLGSCPDSVTPRFLHWGSLSVYSIVIVDAASTVGLGASVFVTEVDTTRRSWRWRCLDALRSVVANDNTRQCTRTHTSL